jgi:hypothetical protein
MTLTRTTLAFVVAGLFFTACSPSTREPTPPERTDIPKVVRPTSAAATVPSHCPREMFCLSRASEPAKRL